MRKIISRTIKLHLWLPAWDYSLQYFSWDTSLGLECQLCTFYCVSLFPLITKHVESLPQRNDLLPETAPVLWIKIVFFKRLHFSRKDRTCKSFGRFNLIENPIRFPPPVMFCLGELSLPVVPMKIWPGCVETSTRHCSKKQSR